MTHTNTLLRVAGATLAATAAFSLTSPAQAAPLAEKIHVEPIAFASNQEKMVGRLYLPTGVSATHPAPGVVVTGAWMTVKEQMATRYAQEMASRGFVALTFDFRGWGESGGARRQLEDPQAKIADIVAAVAYLRSRPEVAGQGIGGLGICASSGYMVTAATRTEQLDSVALVAPWLHDKAIVEEIYGGPDKVAALIAKGRQAQTDYERTGTQKFVSAASLTDSDAIMFKAPYYTQPERGEIPQWRNQADPAFWEGWLSFDAMPPAPLLKQPFFMVESEAAAAPQGAHKFYAKVKAPKSELWLDKVTQFDFYDQKGPVKQSSDAVAQHFAQTLRADEHEQIQRISLLSASLADARDWKALRAVFAPQVRVDYETVTGAAPAVVSADDLVEGWAKGLGSYAQTKHNFSGFTVTRYGDNATCTFTGQATHLKANGERWSCGGNYVHQLTRTPDGWKIVAAKFDMTWEQGTR